MQQNQIKPKNKMENGEITLVSSIMFLKLFYKTVNSETRCLPFLSFQRHHIRF